MGLLIINAYSQILLSGENFVMQLILPPALIGEKFYPHFFSLVLMITYSWCIGKNKFHKYFCNAKIAGLGKIFSPMKIFGQIV